MVTIEQLCAGIFRMEGQPLDHPNPGNLRDCPWFPQDTHLAATGGQGKHRAYPDGTWVSYNGAFWMPRSRAEGVAGAAHVVALRVAMGQSLREFISAWAPPSDGNNTEAYIKAMKQWTGIEDENKPLWDLLEVAPLTLPGDKPVLPT